MKRRGTKLLLLALLVAILIPSGAALADRFPEDCADGEWEIRPDQTLGFVAYTCGTTVTELVQFNGLDNPNLVNPGQVLILPNNPNGPVTTAPAGDDFTSGGTSGDEEPPVVEPVTEETEEPPTTPVEEAPAQSAPPVSVSSGDVTVAFNGLRYINQGRAAVVNVTVTNNNVLPAVEGGLQYHEPQEDGGYKYVTLLGVLHQVVPIALIDEAPLWTAYVTTSDGNVWRFPVGCEYLETVEYVGFEPTADGGFDWFVNWTGGWYDCGNDYDTYPPDLLPGDSAEQELIIYLQHPREWNNSAPPSRTVAGITLDVFTSDGGLLQNVGSISYSE